MFARRRYSVPLPGRPPLALGARTLVMGILNVTPDSFADGGVRFDAAARRRRRAADDRGRRRHHRHRRRVDAARAPSRCRPDEELRRVLPVVERLAAAACTSRSRSTPTRRVVAREALARGATIVNDISGLQYDPALAQVVAETRRGARPDAHARPLARHVSARRSTRTCAAEVARRARGGHVDARGARGRRARRDHRRSRASGSPSAPSTAYEVAGAASTARRARPADPVRALAQVVPEGRARRHGRRRSASGARPRPWPPACCSARTSSASTACARWLDVVRVADRIARPLRSISPCLDLTGPRTFARAPVCHRYRLVR